MTPEQLAEIKRDWDAFMRGDQAAFGRVREVFPAILDAAQRAERAEAEVERLRVAGRQVLPLTDYAASRNPAYICIDREFRAALSPAPAPAPASRVLWAFNCRAERMDDGHYRVTLTGSQSKTVRTRTGYHPMWELIRLLAEEPAPSPDAGGAA